MSVRDEILHGVFWIALAKYSGVIISILITAILARLISPEAFGTIAIAMVILFFLNILADIGIGPAIVQYKQLTSSNLNGLFSLTFYIGLLLCTLLYFSSGVIAYYYTDRTLEAVCQWMSIVILFNSWNIVPNALMRRDKRFKTIAIRTLFFQVLSGVIAIWGAYHGWGIYALLVAPISTAIGVFLVNFYNYPQKLLLVPNWQSIKIVASYSFYQFAFTFSNYFSRNLDKLIIGKNFTMRDLGYYDKSYHLMMVPLSNISFVIDPVLHPILSALQDSRSLLKEKTVSLGKYLSCISFPISLVLFFCANEIITIVYGDKWEPSVPIFRILALSLPLQIILSTNAPLFQSAGKTKILFFSGILNTFFTVTGFLIAVYIFRTLTAVAWAWDITLMLNFINTYIILHRFVLSESPISFFRSLLPQTFNSLIVISSCMFFFHYIYFDNLFINLLFKSIVILAMNALLAQLFGQYQLKYLFCAILKRKITK